MSADGYIAKDTNHAALWTSKEDKKRFVEITKRAGVVVMGSKTYKTLQRPLKERVNIIYSRSGVFEGAETTQDKPQDLLQKLEARGFKEVAICGGAEIYSMFMKSGLVSKIYLTIEPVLFGKGVHLFNDDFHRQLTLVSAGQAENGALLLEYNVKHSDSHIA
jgi:dihydrofolate reductase